MYSSNIARTRYTGLASGVDIDALVKASMQLYYTRIDAATKQKTLNEWKQEAYRDMNTKISDFNNKYFSYSSADNLVSSNNMQSKKVNLTENSYVKVTAGSTADLESHTITDVTVASKAELASSKLVGSNGETMKSSNLNNMTLSELSDLFKANNGTFADADENGNYTVTLSVNGGKEITKTFSADTKVSDFLSAINNSGIDAKLSFDEISRRFEFKTNETGKDQTISISGAMFGNGTVTATGTNASVTIDGEKHESKTNKITVGGLTFEALANAPKTVVENSDGTTAEVGTLNLNMSVSKDTDAIFNRIKSFVEDYNKLISEINTEVSTIKSSAYLPLTDEEKDAMKDSDIEEWTKKAKQGLFYNDSTLKTLVSKMRSIFSESYVDGIGFTKNNEVKGITFASIGIKTGDYKSKGQLVLDESKLKEALENDPEGVAAMFSGENGLAARFSSALESAVENIRDVKIAGFTKNISSYDDKINDLYDVLETKEDALYDRYANMETTLANLQSQMSYLGF